MLRIEVLIETSYLIAKVMILLVWIHVMALDAIKVVKQIVKKECETHFLYVVPVDFPKEMIIYVMINDL